MAREGGTRSVRALEIHRRRRGGPESRSLLRDRDPGVAVHDDDHPAVAVQQLLRRIRHPLGSDSVDSRRAAGRTDQPAAHLRLHLGHHAGDRRRGPRRRRGGPQHRAGGHLLSAPSARIHRRRGRGARGGPAVPAGDADHAGDRGGSAASDVPIAPELPQRGARVSRARFGMVGSALRRRGLGPQLRHPADPDADASSAGRAKGDGRPFPLAVRATSWPGRHAPQGRPARPNRPFAPLPAPAPRPPRRAWRPEPRACGPGCADGRDRRRPPGW